MNQRVQYSSFVENQTFIENRWDKNWGTELMNWYLSGRIWIKIKCYQTFNIVLLMKGKKELFDKNKVLKIRFQRTFKINF